MGITVTLPWQFVEQYVQEWEQRAAVLHAEAEELEAAVAAARAQTRGPYPPKTVIPPVTTPPATPPSGNDSGKTPKGENQRRIVEWLKSAGPVGAPISAICKGSGVGQSSVHIVLKRGDGTVFKKDDTTRMWSLMKP